MFYPLVKHILKKNLESAISERLSNVLETLNRQLVGLSDAAKHRLNREPELSEWLKIPPESSARSLQVQIKEEWKEGCYH